MLLAAVVAKEVGEGYFVQPTVIADVDPQATIAQQEIFGPVLAVYPVRATLNMASRSPITPNSVSRARSIPSSA